MPRHSLLRLFLVSLVFLLSFHTASSQCGGAGYDLSSLANTDLSYQDSTYTYYVHACGGNVVNANCSSGNTMFCQWSATTRSYQSFAAYNTTATNWLAVTGGVQQTVQDALAGAACSAVGALRTATIFYHCNASATTAYISAVVQTQTCHWRATIETRAACAATGATAGHVVGSSYYDSRCGGGVYNLASVSSQPLRFTSNTTSATLQLCGPLPTSTCLPVWQQRLSHTILRHHSDLPLRLQRLPVRVDHHAQRHLTAPADRRLLCYGGGGHCTDRQRRVQCLRHCCRAQCTDAE